MFQSLTISNAPCPPPPWLRHWSATCESWENPSVVTSLLGISYPIRVRIRFGWLYGPIQFAAFAPQIATAHVDSLIRSHTVAISCRMPHAACRMPHAACRMPHAACRMPHAACRMPHAACRVCITHPYKLNPSFTSPRR